MSETGIHDTDSGAAGAPAARGIALSDSAVERLREVFAAEGRPDAMLRVTVNGGGCSGFTYSFDVDDTRNDDDVTWETDGITVVVDEASLQFVDGSVLNFVETLGGSHFQLENPNATSSCGCGSSFSVF